MRDHASKRLRASASLRIKQGATIIMDEKTDGKASSRYVQVIWVGPGDEATDGQGFMAVSKQTLSSGDSVCLNPCTALCYNYNSHEVSHGFMRYLYCRP